LAAVDWTGSHILGHQCNESSSLTQTKNTLHVYYHGTKKQTALLHIFLSSRIKCIGTNELPLSQTHKSKIVITKIYFYGIFSATKLQNIVIQNDVK